MQRARNKTTSEQNKKIPCHPVFFELVVGRACPMNQMILGMNISECGKSYFPVAQRRCAQTLDPYWNTKDSVVCCLLHSCVPYLAFFACFRCVARPPSVGIACVDTYYLSCAIGQKKKKERKDDSAALTSSLALLPVCLLCFSPPFFSVVFFCSLSVISDWVWQHG